MEMEHFYTTPMTDEEIKSMIMPGWVCPICKTKGHISVLSRTAAFCNETGLIVSVEDCSG